MIEQPLPPTAGYSHLFRGIRLSLPHGLAPPLRPCEVRLAFSDGVELAAELLTARDGELLLATPAYRTAAGSDVGPGLWPVREVADSADSGQLTLRLGPRVA